MDISKSRSQMNSFRIQETLLRSNGSIFTGKARRSSQQILNPHIIVRDQSKDIKSFHLHKEFYMFKGKNWLHGLILIVMMFSFSSTAAAQGPSDETEVFYIAGVFDVETRSAIAASGALIPEVGHDDVLVEATPREKRAIERQIGRTIAKPTLEQAIPLAFPSADSNY